MGKGSGGAGRQPIPSGAGGAGPIFGTPLGTVTISGQGLPARTPATTTEPREEFQKITEVGGSDWIRNLHAPLAAQMTAAERSVIGSFQGSGYGGINGYMLGAGSGGTREQILARANAKENTRRLQRAVRRGEITRNIRVYRGAGSSALSMLATWNVGDVKSYSSFMSTSTSRSFANSWGGEGVLFHIQVPKGARGLYLNAITGNQAGEREILLPAGTSFRVLQKKMISGKMHVYLRVIADSTAG